jgi:hypothetical protein
MFYRIFQFCSGKKNKKKYFFQKKKKEMKKKMGVIKNLIQEKKNQKFKKLKN